MEKTALLVLGIVLFAAGCYLGIAANQQILREISLAISPNPATLTAVKAATPYVLFLSIAIAPGLFLAIPTIAIGVIKPRIRSLLLRSIGVYLLSTLISVVAAFVWFLWTVTYGRSALTYEHIPALSVALAGPIAVLVLSAVLSSKRAPDA